MNQTLTELIDAMDAEMKSYLKMLPVLAKERHAATRSDRTRLTQAGQIKQGVVAEIAQMEKKRRALVERLGDRYAIEERPISVSRLCEHLEEPDAAALKKRARELKTLVETVQRENNANARLFSHALDLVHGSLKLLNDLIYSQWIYEKPGSTQPSKGYGGARGRVFCGSV